MSDETLKIILEAMGKSGGPECANEPICAQYQHSLARFNDTSAQTVNAVQQQFAQWMSVQSAHLLRLQADICRTDKTE